MIRLSSSIRTRSISESLFLAQEVANSLGVTRVTEITWLDKIGLPVYAGIRHNALEGSVNVLNGKGMQPDEAKIGAFMKCIEFSLSEGSKHHLQTHKYPLGEVQNSLPPGLPVSAFGINLGVSLSPEHRIDCVEAWDIISCKSVLIPAQFFFHSVKLEGQRAIYGSTTTNALCSGNSKLEAVIHGVSDVLGRDVKFLDLIEDRSALVDIQTEPYDVKLLRNKIEDAGLTVILRKSINEFNLPYYTAFVLEKEGHSSIAITEGYALHPIAEIAAVRAITEAVQNRLKHIHSGRDDVIKRINFHLSNPSFEEMVILDTVFRKIVDKSHVIPFSEPQELIAVPSSMDELWFFIKEKMLAAGLCHCFIHELNPTRFPFNVLRVVVPLAEFTGCNMKNVGPRFLKLFKQRHLANQV